MSAFDYEALDSRGRTRRGVISADSPRAARRELKRLHLAPLSLKPAAEGRTKPGQASLSAMFGRDISAKDLTLLTRQMATLIQATAPVEESLQMIALQAEKPVVRRTLLSVRERVAEGRRLSDALTAHPGSFSQMYRAMVAAGEASGTLGQVMDRLADHLEASEKLRGKITSALIYPAFLILTAIAIVSILMVYVVPKVVDQFDTLGQQLPLLTRVMIGLSEAMQLFGLPALLGLTVGLLVFLRALRVDTFRRRVDRVLLGLPLIGRMVRQAATARLARTLSTLLASGATLMDGLTACRLVIGNRVMRDGVEQVRQAVQEGTAFSTALRRTALFPPMLVYMAAMGERGGRLDVMLGKTASYLEETQSRFIDGALSLLEPVIILIMGAMVATIVISIMLPILQLNKAVVF